MPTDPRHSGFPGGYPPMVVQVSESKQAWLPIAVLGMMTMQFLVVALIAWRILTPQGLPTVLGRRRPARNLPPNAPYSTASSANSTWRPMELSNRWKRQRQQNDELKSSNLGLLTRVREMSEAQQKFDAQLQATLRRNDSLQATIDRLKSDRTETIAQVKQLKERLAKYEQVDDEEEEKTDARAWLAHWKWYVGGFLVLLMAMVAGVYALYGPVRDEDDAGSRHPAGLPPFSRTLPT